MKIEITEMHEDIYEVNYYKNLLLKHDHVLSVEVTDSILIGRNCSLGFYTIEVDDLSRVIEELKIETYQIVL